jgi:hypothetical protein
MSRKQTMDLVDQPVDPDAKRAYRETIARAKARGRRERPGPMEGTPNFDDIQEPRMTVDAVRGPQKPQEQGLSPDTEAGLKALAAAQRKPVPQEPAAEVEASEDAAAEPESRELTNEEESDAIRETIEARVEEFDIGQYILSGGEMTQTVPIIPGKLEVTFRTATDYEEWYVDNQLAKDRDITARQYVRRTNEWGLAMHISSLAGDKWPLLFKPNGDINEEAVQERLRKVRKLPSPLFNLLTQNLLWFLDRVSKALSIEVLGNG